MSKPTYIKHPFNGSMMVIAVPDSATENALTQKEWWLLEYDAAVRELSGKLAAKEKELAHAMEYRYTHQEVAAWLDCYEGRYRELTLTEWVAKRRQEAGEMKK